MDKLLKPARLSIDPNSSTASKEWKHWIRTFKSYVNRFVSSEENSSEADEEKLAALVSCATADVYEFIDHCESYAEAEETLERLYVKKPNDIFARYLLRIARQKPDQTLADFRRSLIKLAKDCCFNDVTAAEYRDALIRDSFIDGILSSEIRQRLLEHKTLTMKEAYEQAVTIDDAKRDSRMFCSASVDCDKTEVLNFIDTADEVARPQPVTTASTSVGACRKCGGNKPHDFKQCKAKFMNCFKCGERGHLSRVCHMQRSSGPSRAAKAGATTAVMQEFISSISLGTTGSDDNSPYVTCCSKIKGKVYPTMLDTGSSKCFVKEAVAAALGIRSAPFCFKVGMAQMTSHVQVSQLCRVDISLFGQTYKNISLYVMKDLCKDIILGRDFLGLHKSVTFPFDGPRESLVVPKSGFCGVTAAKIQTPSLFSNLRPGWRPVATQSRRFNLSDKSFIASTVSQWKQSGTVRPSKSPWRAQCVVVRNGGKAQRLAIDYSQTINLFTEKTAFRYH